MTQEALAKELGVSKRTVARWEMVEAFPNSEQVAHLARRVHPHNRQIASQLAARIGLTLAQLGVQPKADARSLRSQAESLIQAASQASGAPTEAVRAALVAAFHHARVHGLSVDQVSECLAAAKSG